MCGSRTEGLDHCIDRGSIARSASDSPALPQEAQISSTVGAEWARILPTPPSALAGRDEAIRSTRWGEAQTDTAIATFAHVIRDRRLGLSWTTSPRFELEPKTGELVGLATPAGWWATPRRVRLRRRHFGQRCGTDDGRPFPRALMRLDVPDHVADQAHQAEDDQAERVENGHSDYA